MNHLTFQEDMESKTALYGQPGNPFQQFPLASPGHSDQDDCEHSSPLSEAWTGNPSTCDLRDILLYYREQPELLRLILLSKVEEDKRRAQEAELRARELDIILLQQHSLTSAALMADTAMPSSASHFFACQTTPVKGDAQQTTLSLQRQSNILDSPHSPVHPNASLASSLADSDDTFGNSYQGFAPPESVAVSSPTLFFPVTTYTPSVPLMTHAALPAPSPASTTETSLENRATRCSESTSRPPTPPEQQLMSGKTCESLSVHHQQRARRRREMQAISKIVETRDYPYLDGYFWKNNGNTVQKKTGNKSVYYKCSNSNKGCQVNKTVTWKGNGEFLIKYRGDHLLECGKVQRIVDK